MAKSDYRPTRSKTQNQKGLPGAGVPLVYLLAVQTAASPPWDIDVFAVVPNALQDWFEAAEIWEPGRVISPENYQVIRNAVLIETTATVVAPDHILIEGGAIVPGDFEIWFKPGAKDMTTRWGWVSGGCWIDTII